MYTVAEIWRYPVKSMSGERVDAASVDTRGLVGDRAHALIDMETGKVASGSYRARRWADLLAWSASHLAEPRRNGLDSDVRIDPPSGTSLRPGTPGIDAQLSRALGRPVRLATAGREQDSVMYGDPPPGTFQDVGTLHLLTTGTLTRLAELAPSASFDVRRFRPNLVIDTADETGFPEDQWLDRTLTIGGDLRLRVTGRCPRCVMTTHPQGDLPKDRDVLRSAARFNDANVGVYAEVVTPGRLQVGQMVRLSA